MGGGDFILFLYYFYIIISFLSFLIGKHSDSDISDYVINMSSDSSNESIIHVNQKRKQKIRSCKYMSRYYVYQNLLQSFFIINYICFAGHESYKKKKRWTNKETTDANNYFSNYIRKRKLPPLPEIEKVKMTCNILKDRKPDIIKTWIHNQFKKNSTVE